MGFLANLFKDEEPKALSSAAKTGINAILLGPPGSGKGTQVIANYTCIHLHKTGRTIYSSFLYTLIDMILCWFQ